jgi:hypothetical protein
LNPRRGLCYDHDFQLFSAEKNGVFHKTKCSNDPIFETTSSSLSKKRQFFAYFLSEKIFSKIMTSVPGSTPQPVGAGDRLGPLLPDEAVKTARRAHPGTDFTKLHFGRNFFV